METWKRSPVTADTAPVTAVTGVTADKVVRAVRAARVTSGTAGSVAPERVQVTVAMITAPVTAVTVQITTVTAPKPARAQVRGRAGPARRGRRVTAITAPVTAVTIMAPRAVTAPMLARTGGHGAAPAALTERAAARPSERGGRGSGRTRAECGQRAQVPRRRRPQRKCYHRPIQGLEVESPPNRQEGAAR